MAGSAASDSLLASGGALRASATVRGFVVSTIMFRSMKKLRWNKMDAAFEKWKVYEPGEEAGESGWQEVADETGEKYFYNYDTGESAWDKPVLGRGGNGEWPAPPRGGSTAARGVGGEAKAEGPMCPRSTVQALPSQPAPPPPRARRPIGAVSAETEMSKRLAAMRARHKARARPARLPPGAAPVRSCTRWRTAGVPTRAPREYPGRTSQPCALGEPQALWCAAAPPPRPPPACVPLPRCV